MILPPSEVKDILAQTLSYVKADEAEVSIYAGLREELRFARNMPISCGYADETHIYIMCAFGQQVGYFSTTETNATALENAVRRAEDAAHLAPESPEYMPRLGPQQYLHTPAWDAASTHFSAHDRARIASLAIDGARDTNLTSAGFFENSQGYTGMMNTSGLFAYRCATHAAYSLTMRTSDGMGSGWAAAESFRVAAIDGGTITKRAVEKAIQSQNPTPLEPGAYTVVLEPSAVGDMLNIFRGSLDRRAADEGRSYFSNVGQGTKIGQTLFGDNITIYSDPTHAIVPGWPWGENGLPLHRTSWVEKGTLRNLVVSRYWAQQKNIEPMPHGSNIIMEGQEHTLDDLIAATERGLLVTSLWYIRGVDPQTMLHTGLTRDGVFLIERGKVTRPVVNLRWNESPAAIFKCVEMMSRPERVVTREGNGPILAPALKIKEFHFTSVSPST
ncbi:MAG: TldD/PmbA family protein [Abitibacteriaceae bacterium]|nr:TldD/PmbA family protein [Abditibacteriaceae bacterium]